MQNIIIENNEDQMILKLNKKAFNKEYLLSLVKRLQVEEFVEEANFDSEIMKIAEKIDQEWWDKNGDEFLKGIKK